MTKTVEKPKAKRRRASISERRLSLKQKGFIEDYITTGNATEAAQRNYDVASRNVARAVGAENLAKPAIKTAIEELGFSVEGAKSVVQELLYDKRVKPVDRISAAREVFKVEGSYAPEKHLHATFSLVQLGNGIAELSNPTTNALENTQKEGLQLEAPDEDTA